MLAMNWAVVSGAILAPDAEGIGLRFDAGAGAGAEAWTRRPAREDGAAAAEAGVEAGAAGAAGASASELLPRV